MLTVYADREDSLGDFLNCFPVLKGIYDSHGKFKLVVKHATKRFNGFRDFLMYQDLFVDVLFDDEIYLTDNPIHLHKHDDRSQEDKKNPNQPKDVFRYAKTLNIDYGMNIEVDDSVILKCPDIDLEIEDTYYVGDRWDHPHRDYRRSSNTLTHLNNFRFIDYNNTLLHNCYILKNLKKPFITNLTGIAVMADLLNKETYIVWKEEDWATEFRKNGNIVWDDAESILDIFNRHFYNDRNCMMVHSQKLEYLL